MDFEKEVLPGAFEVLKSRELSEQEKSEPYWKYQAKFALQDQLSDNLVIDLEDAVLWSCIEHYSGTDESALDREYERKLESLQQTLGHICKPGAVSMVIGRNPELTDEDGQPFDDDDNPLRDMYFDSDMLRIEGATISGVTNVTFNVPAKSGARRVAGSQSTVPSATFWLAHHGLVDRIEGANQFTSLHPSEAMDDDDVEVDVSEHDQKHEAYDNYLHDVADSGLCINVGKDRTYDMQPVEVDLNLLTERVITSETALTPQLLTSIMTEGGYVVAGKQAVAQLLEALDPARCVIPGVHDVPHSLPRTQNDEEAIALAIDLVNHPFQKLLFKHRLKASAEFDKLKDKNSNRTIDDLCILMSDGVPFGQYVTNKGGQMRDPSDREYSPELSQDLELMHNILLNIEKHDRMLMRYALARQLRASRGFYEDYSSQDRHTGVLLGNEGIVVANIVAAERDYHVDAALNAHAAEIVQIMLSVSDPFTAAHELQEGSVDLHKHIEIIHADYKSYFDIPENTLEELHAFVRRRIEASIEQAKLNVERLGQTALQRFDEYKDSPEFTNNEELYEDEDL